MAKIMNHPIWVPSGKAKKILLGSFPLSWHFQMDNFMSLFTISQDLLLVTWSHPYPIHYGLHQLQNKSKVSSKFCNDYSGQFFTICLHVSPSRGEMRILTPGFKKMSLRWAMCFSLLILHGLCITEFSPPEKLWRLYIGCLFLLVSHICNTKHSASQT